MSKDVVITVVTIIITIAIIFGISYAKSANERNHYTKAIDTIVNGNYEEGIELLMNINTDLGDFDIQTWIEYANNGIRYDKAVQKMEKEEYYSAILEFECLGSFKDSETLLQECQYNYAVSKYEEGNTRDCIIIFGEILGYKDSYNYFEECVLKEANRIWVSKALDGKNLYYQGEYEEALEILGSIPDFNTSDFIDSCKVRLGIE